MAVSAGLFIVSAGLFAACTAGWFIMGYPAYGIACIMAAVVSCMAAFIVRKA